MSLELFLYFASHPPTSISGMGEIEGFGLNFVINRRIYKVKQNEIIAEPL